MKTMLTFITCAVTGFIFAQSTAPLDVKVLSESGKPYVGDKIYFVGQTSKASFSGVTNAAGKFHIELPQGDVYDIKIMSIGDELEYNTLEIPVLKEGEMFEMMELEIMYEAAKNYTLDNLQFDTGKSTIKTVSFPILDNIAELMLLKPTMKIEIAGHTDSDGDDAANLALSQQRADAVKQYLAKKGIAANRMAAKGYGETRPIADNGTAAGKQQNRRTEIRVL
ncbi:MAG TPA: OmpA family protein [Fluviicola sp.]|nr:OmpA family protein [Fluviicola sp.]